MDEIQKIGEQLVNVRIELGQLSTKMDAIKDMSKKLDDVENVSNKAMESTKQAHHRLDEIKRNEPTITDAISTANSNQTRIEKIEKWFSWLATTVFGAIILAIIGFLVTGGFKIK